MAFPETGLCHSGGYGKTWMTMVCLSLQVHALQLGNVFLHIVVMTTPTAQ